MSSSPSSSSSRLEQLLLRRVERQASQAARELSADDHAALRNTIHESVQRRTPVRDLADVLPSHLKTTSGGTDATTSFRAKSSLGALPPQRAARKDMQPIAEPERRTPLRITPAPLLPMPVEDPGAENLWAVLNRQAAAEEQERQLIEKHVIRKQQIAAQHQVLEEQVSVRRSHKELTAKQLRQEQQVIEEAARAEEVRKKQEADKLMETAKRIKADREEQARQRAERKAKEQEARRRTEAMLLERIAEEVVEEESRKERLRKREEQFRQELVAANEEQKQRKAERRAAEEALEREAVASYDERLLRQEAARTAAFSVVQKKMKGRETIIANYLQKLGTEEAAAKDEERALRHQQEMTRLAEAAEAKKLQAQESLAKEVLQFQSKQVEEKRRQVELERAAEQQEKQRILAAVAKEQEQINREREVRRSKQLSFRDSIEHQIRDASTRRLVVMSEEEQRLNAALLARARSTSPSLSTPPHSLTC